jgi:malate/lactate dehydrogenase
MSVKVSIIGAAGTLGSCAAYAVATQGLCDELVLFDINENLLKCHVLDLETAVTSVQNVKVWAGSDEDLSGSRIVIVAAGAPWRFITSRMELLRDNLPIIEELTLKIRKYCPQAVVITATNPVDLMNYAMGLLAGLDRKRFIGYSYNDSFRFRMMAARLLKINATSVEGLTIGEHGPHQVMLFSTLRVNGKPVDLSDEDKQKIRDEVPKALQTYESLGTGRTTGWTSAVGLSDIVSGIVNNSGRVIPTSVALDGEYGYSGLSASVPVRLGKDGVQEIIELKLSPDEEKGVKDSLAYLKEACQSVEDLLKPAKR